LAVRHPSRERDGSMAARCGRDRSWLGPIVLGFLVRVAQDAPTIIAFLDELRGRGFVEGQNFTIVRGRFQVRNE
jgi:hypothetical protein